MSRVTLTHWRCCPHCLMLTLNAEVRKSFIGEFLLSHPEREIDDNLREFESHFTVVTSHQKAQNLWWHVMGHVTHVMQRSDRSDTDWVSLLSPGSDSCLLCTQDTLPGVGTTLGFCLQPQTLHSVNIDTTTRNTSATYSQKSAIFHEIFGLFMSSSNKLSLRSGLKHKQTRIAYQTWHPEPKISLPQDWLNISGIFI